MAHFNTTLKRNSKLDLSRPDLLKLVSMLEGELQAREIVIAVLKSEQIKSLLNPSKQPTMISGFKNDRQLDNCNNNKSNELTADQTIIKRSSDPLVALSRDSFVVYEPSLNYSISLALYNIKMFQLENLINNYKRFHVKEKEQIKYLENVCENLMIELEEERRKNKFYESQYQDYDRRKLESEIGVLNKTLEETKDKTKQMILFLLDERKQLILKLIEEKRQNDELKQELNAERSKITEMVEGLEDESKRSLQMEAELEKYLNDFDKERNEYRQQLQSSETKNMELMTEIERLKNLVEILQNQIPANTKAGIINNNFDGGAKEKSWNLGEGVRSSIVTMPVGPKVQSLSSVNPVFHPKASVAQPIITKNASATGGVAACATNKSIQDMNPNIILPPPSIPVPQPKQQQQQQQLSNNLSCSINSTTIATAAQPPKTSITNFELNNSIDNETKVITDNLAGKATITSADSSTTVKQTVKFYESSAANQIKQPQQISKSTSLASNNNNSSTSSTMMAAFTDQPNHSVPISTSVKKPSPGPRPTPPPIPPNKPSIKPVLPSQAALIVQNNKNSNNKQSQDANSMICNKSSSLHSSNLKAFNLNNNNHNAQTTTTIATSISNNKKS